MELLKKSIGPVLEKGRIGSPVFLRCMLHTTSKAPSLLQSASEIVELSNAWIPSAPQNIYAQGDDSTTQITVMVQYTEGQMAVLSVNQVDTETALDIMLVGNKGVIYYETPIGRHYLSGTPPQLDSTDEFKDIITQSLATGQPITVEDKHAK